MLYKAELLAICGAIIILLVIQTHVFKADEMTSYVGLEETALFKTVAQKENDELAAYTNEVRRLTSDAGYTEEQIRIIAADLFSANFGVANMSKLEPLLRNEAGFTYGPEALGADLISCIADDGKPGFVYASEMNPETDGLVTPEQIERAASEDIVLNVYAADGKEVIGEFTLTA